MRHRPPDRLADQPAVAAEDSMNDIPHPRPSAHHAPHGSSQGAAHSPPADRPLPASLRRNAPLVPVDSAGGRALAAVIGILTFLAALCAGGAELVGASSAQWRSDVSREVTIQVRPSPQRDMEADVGRAVALARGTASIESAQAFTKAESERLLEPWL